MSIGNLKTAVNGKYYVPVFLPEISKKKRLSLRSTSRAGQSEKTGPNPTLAGCHSMVRNKCLRALGSEFDLY